jgi:hypothetical protein
MNHIATGRALSPGGELIPTHHRRQKHRWRWWWSRWRWLWGQFSVPAGSRNRDFYPPKLVFDGGSAAELYLGKCRFFLGFSRRRLYIDGEAMSEGTRGPHTKWWRGKGGRAPPYGVATSWPSSDSPLDSVLCRGK